MTIEAYQVGVNLFANAERITGPIGEMISALERLLQAQKSAQSGFNDMTSALGGARRLARGMADDMERAARAAQNVASASSRFRPSGGGAYSGGGSSTPPVMPPIPPTQAWNGSYVSPYSAAATQVPGAPQVMLPPDEASSPLLLGYDPRGETTVVRGSPQPMYGSSGPGVTVGSPYGPSAPPPLLLEYQPTPRGPMNYANTYGPWKSVSDAPPAGSGLRAAGEYMSGLGMPRVGPFMGAAAAYAGWRGASEAFGSALHQTGAYDQTFLSMQGDPVARANMDAIKASAEKAIRDNPFLTVPESAQIAQDAFELSGGQMDEQDPIATLLNRVNRTFQAQGKAPAAAMAESKAFIRAQDISNRFYNPQTGEFDLGRASQSTDAALGMHIANQQFMSGQKYLTFARSAGVAAQHMSDEGTLNMAHFIDVNPSRAATAVKSLENLFGGDHTRMTDKDFAYFSHLGLIGRNGQFFGQDQLSTDPIGWITHYLSPLIKSHPELLGHIQRMNVADLAAETTGAQGNIARQYATAKRTDAARAVNAMESGQQDQSLIMHAAWERLEFTIGRAAQGPFISSLQALTGAFNGISDFVSKHPDDIRQFASDISALVRVTGSIAAGIGYVMNIVPGPIRRILESAAAGAATGAVGGSIIPGAGTAAGAVGGAVVGAIAGVANEGGHQARRVDAAVNRQPAQGSNSQPIQVTTQVMLDRRVLAEAVTMHAQEQARQDMRASGTAPDLMQYAQYPGRSVGQ
ncbi:hypothetical protein [Acetobacter lambici]|uniref:Phage tail tape measure protein domain-containing protein n=2 Tax=Acetobacter lambici TaxID=1332824 RepID=A0ABT1F0R4_9PROT|nr:hypothetical protein [Acetobacter lambici]MCP1258571.1 hypothetical protein [Acetobacter lambici]